jgi:hypothetical protein
MCCWVQRIDIFKMFILPPFVVYCPVANSVFPIFAEVRISEIIPPLALYAFMVCVCTGTNLPRTLQLLPDLKFRIRDLNIMFVNICEFLTNCHRENKECLAKSVYYVSVYTICRFVIIIPNHSLNAKFFTLDHSAAMSLSCPDYSCLTRDWR